MNAALTPGFVAALGLKLPGGVTPADVCEVDPKARLLPVRFKAVWAHTFYRWCMYPRGFYVAVMMADAAVEHAVEDEKGGAR